MAVRDGYIGRSPGESSVMIAKQSFSPSGSTSEFTFTSGYEVGYLDVFKNGVRLLEGSEYTAGDGSKIKLTVAVGSGTTIEAVAQKAFNLQTVDATSASSDFTVAGDLTVAGASNLQGTTKVGSAVTFANDSGINVTGVVTATSFVGALTGNVTGNASGSSGSCTGNAAGLTGTPSITVQDIVAVGATFTGVVTYEDVTNVDSVGIVTARAGVRVSSGGIQAVGIYTGLKAGISTFSNDISIHGTAGVGAGTSIKWNASANKLRFNDNTYAEWGDGSDLAIYHDPTHGHSFIKESGSGGLIVGASVFEVYDAAISDKIISATADGAVELYYDNTKRIETTTDGAVVTGIMTATSDILIDSKPVATMGKAIAMAMVFG